MKLFRLTCVVLLFIAHASAQKVLLMGVKHPDQCKKITEPLIADLNAIPFPRDWKIVVACTQTMWNEIQQQADASATHTAFTSLAGHMTVLNGTIYTHSGLFLEGSGLPFPRSVLQHELGLIRCQCKDEEKADKAGGAH